MRWWFLPLARPCGPSDDYWGISVLLRWGGGGQRTPPHQTEYLARALSESQPSTPTQNHPKKQTNMCSKHSRRLTGVQRNWSPYSGASSPPVLQDNCKTKWWESAKGQTPWFKRHMQYRHRLTQRTEPGMFFPVSKTNQKIIHLESWMCED